MLQFFVSYAFKITSGQTECDGGGGGAWSNISDYCYFSALLFLFDLILQLIQCR